MLKIGLIGAGSHAMADHAPALRHCADDDEFRGRVELSGVCDIDVAKAKDAANRFGFRRAYASIDALLSEVNAVVSIVPPAALVTTLEPILRHRRPVLIEKPLGRNLAEARRIAEMLHGYPHMVSLNRRFDPAVTIARQWLAKQSPPGFVHGVMERRDRTEPDFIWSTGVHMTDLSCFLLGPLRSITSRRGAGRKHVAAVAGAGELRGLIEIWPTAARVEEHVHVGGDDWYAKIDTGTHQAWSVLCVRSARAEVRATADPATPAFVRNGAPDETAAFLRGVLNNGMPGPTVSDAMPGTELAAAMQAADESAVYDGTHQ